MPEPYEIILFIIIDYPTYPMSINITLQKNITVGPYPLLACKKNQHVLARS